MAKAKEPSAPRTKVEVAMSKSTKNRLKAFAKKNNTSMSEVLGDYARTLVRRK
jgi:hypothetical protein